MHFSPKQSVSRKKNVHHVVFLTLSFLFLVFFFIAFYILTSQFTLYFEAAFFALHPGFEPILGSQG